MEATTNPSTQFQRLGLHPQLTTLLASAKITRPTPVQSDLIPILMQGDNAVVSAPTGSGKTLAYALPIIHRFADSSNSHHYPKILILSPTKELAQQLFSVLKPLAQGVGLRPLLIQGGGFRPAERRRLRKGVDLIIATPQRVKAYKDEGVFDLKSIRSLVIDEADMMLDLGFTPLVTALIPPSRNTQKVLVSATVTRRVMLFAQDYLKPFRRIDINTKHKIADTIEHYLYPVVRSRKTRLLLHLSEKNAWNKTLVFVRKKEDANRLFDALRQLGVSSEILHGERSPKERQKALRRFQTDKISFLIATDVAARGLDIPEIDAVVNYDVPHVKHDFIHRVGRTGRAGKKGTAVSLIAADEIEQLNDLVSLLGEKPREIILPDFAPKIVKARGWLVMPPKQRRYKPKTPPRKIKDPANPRGKKRKTTKRDRRLS